MLLKLVKHPGYAVGETAFLCNKYIAMFLNFVLVCRSQLVLLLTPSILNAIIFLGTLLHPQDSGSCY